MPARDDMKRGRWLGDLLARAASEFFADGLDHLPLPGHDLESFSDRLAELDELAAAAWAGHRRRDHHALARQMRRKRRPHRLPAGERIYCRGRNNRPFLFFRPAPSPLRAGDHLNSRHRTVSRTGASTVICTDASTRSQIAASAQGGPRRTLTSEIGPQLL